MDTLLDNNTQEELVHKEMLSVADPVNIESTIGMLQDEHQRLQSRLDELDDQVWLTPEEQVERKNCQKMKLATKDRIHVLRRMLS